METLVSAVTNILCKRVTEEEAMEFSRDNFGDLVLYIKDNLVKELLESKAKGNAIYIGYEKLRHERKNKKL